MHGEGIIDKVLCKPIGAIVNYMCASAAAESVFWLAEQVT